MTRASYRRGIEWIATNDEPEETDGQSIARSISVTLLADLFGKEPDEVAAAVLRYRAKSKEP